MLHRSVTVVTMPSACNADLLCSNRSEGVLVRVFEKVKPMGHSDEVLAALDELQKGR